MDDLSEKLAEILNDPESMNKVRSLAENLLGESASDPQPEPAQSPFPFDGSAAEIRTIMQLISQLKNTENDSRAQLLMALKPHLSEPRREKVDTAVKLLKLIELLPLIRESGILGSLL